MSDPLAIVASGWNGIAGSGNGHSDHRKGAERGGMRSEEASRMEREKMLGVALSQIERQYGKGAVMRLGEHPMGQGVAVIPSGSLALDIALGIGGIPRGRIIEVYGPEGSGKTTVCLHMIAEAQKRGGIAVFIDAEHALDPIYSKTLGVNVDELLVSQPDNGEQALEIADMMVRSGAVDIVVIDSVAALVPRAEIEGEMGDSHVGLQARLMSQAMRKLAGSLSRFDTTAIFINQLREKIGVMFGSPETTTGGRALKFDILYGKGISKEGSLLDIGAGLEIIKKSGAWYTYEGDQLGQGKENARTFLMEHQDIAEEIDRRIREAVGMTAFGPDEVISLEAPEAEALAPASPSNGASKNGAKQPAGVSAG